VDQFEIDRAIHAARGVVHKREMPDAPIAMKGLDLSELALQPDEVRNRIKAWLP